MSQLIFPVLKLEMNKFQVIVDLSIYAKEALIATCYKFTELFYIHQLSNGDKVNIIFESKDGNDVSDETVKQFCNELIDQQVRYITNQQFGHIRDLIVEEAFRPVKK